MLHWAPVFECQFARISAMAKGSQSRVRMLRALRLSVLVAGARIVNLQTASAQTTAPVLISHEDSTRAISFESVTQHREPFSATVPVRFGTDNQTRLMLFVRDLS